MNEYGEKCIEKIDEIKKKIDSFSSLSDKYSYITLCCIQESIDNYLDFMYEHSYKN